MTMHKRKRTLRGILFLFVSLPVTSIAAQQEGIVFDPQSGNYIITYEHEGQLLETTYEPPNKINPVLKSAFRLTPSGDIVYRYRLKNGRDSRQRIGILGVLVSSAKGASISTNAPEYLQHQPTAETALALSADSRKVVLSTPTGWHGSVLPNPRGTGLSITWSFSRNYPTDGLAADKSQSGFGYESQDLPGVGLAGIRGTTPTLVFAGDGPSQEIDDQLSVIQKKTAGVTRPAAIPMFSVPNPFDAPVLLAQLQRHAKADLVGLGLIDPAFAAQLDPWFIAAIEAGKRGDAEGLRRGIKELRKLLKQEYLDADKDEGDDEGDMGFKDDGDNKEEQTMRRIDKLAARVLDFDLKYVEKRTKGMLDD